MPRFDRSGAYGYSDVSLCVPSGPVIPLSGLVEGDARASIPRPVALIDCVGSEHIQLLETKATTVRTYTPKPGDVERTWYVIDAADVVLGRLATHVATLLRGKHKATFAPHIDNGDFVIVINSDKVALTGNKRETKIAYRHSGYPGGLSATTYGDLLATKSDRAVEKAVRGMLPKNSIARAQLTKLKVYTGSEHPHAAQQPKTYTLSQVAQ